MGKSALDLSYYDALAPIAGPEDVAVTGAERTTFYSIIEAQAKTLGQTMLTCFELGLEAATKAW